MLDESECKNSGGWFRDPFTGEDIGPDFPRALTCKPGEKWVQPAVCFQDGNIVRISGRCWNDDERACYKEYRGKSSSKPRQYRTEKRPVEKKSADVDDEPKQVVKFSEESAASIETLEILARCDKLLGVSQIAGVTYLLCSDGSNKVYHLPRLCVPDAEYDRLCGGDE